MASTLHDAVAESKTPLAAPTAVTTTSPLDLDTAQIDQIIGAKGHANAGVYQIGVVYSASTVAWRPFGSKADTNCIMQET